MGHQNHEHCHGDHCHESHEHSCCGGHHHHHHQSCGCGCGCASCKCGECCGKGHECHEDFAHKLLEMADEAWMCLLKEKIKAKIQDVNGAQLDELANLVATTNHKRWTDKLAKKQACEDYECKIADFFARKK